jgi:acyl-coenzyme A thioesterase PaaI-like protein
MHVHGDLPSGFDRAVGVLEQAPGVVEVPRRPFVEQASGSLQGGVVALLGEAAAQSLTGRPVVDLDVRFLSAVRAGPGRATATALDDELVRVEVRDVGRGGRLAALAMVRATPVSHP